MATKTKTTKKAVSPRATKTAKAKAETTKKAKTKAAASGEVKAKKQGAIDAALVLAISKGSMRPGAGEGETELNRLFYRLGWTKGWYTGALRDKVCGEIASDSAKPDWKAIKAKLIEMARKYDGAGWVAA